MFRTLPRTLILAALALLGGALAPAQAEEAAPAAPAPASVEPGACDLSTVLPLDLEQEPIFLENRPGDCSCTQDSDCELVCFDGGKCIGGQCEGNHSLGCECEPSGCPGGTAPGECDDCIEGPSCAYSCCDDSDCQSQCPFGIGSCTRDNKCLCAC